MISKKTYKTYILALLLFFPILGFSQEDSLYNAIKEKIYKLSNEIPALNTEVNISVTDVSIQELFRSLANNAGVNIDVDPQLNFNVVNNFSGVQVKDVLIFLQTKYKLEYRFIGNIITVGPSQPVIADRKNQVFYDFNTNLLTLEYTNIDLKKAVKEITDLTGINVILDPGVQSNSVYGFIKQMPFENALEKFAFTNGLSMKKTDDGFYVLYKEVLDAGRKETKPVQVANYSKPSMKDFSFLREQGVQLDAVSKDSINIYAINVPKYDLVKLVSNRLGINYFIHSGKGSGSSSTSSTPRNSRTNNPNSRTANTSATNTSIAPVAGDNVSLNVVGISYDEFLEYLFSGSSETFSKKNEIYLIGNNNIEELRDWRIVQLQHRTIDSLKQLLPEKLIEGIEFQDFIELNSIFLGGPSYKLDKVQAFIREIDKPVPVIMIEVIIINVSKTYKVSTGIQAGTGTPPTTSQQVFPAVDYTMSADAINDLIAKFDGFGSINLGNVSPDFYMTLKALEEEGILDVESTPKLSTLNGHKATLSIGNIEYYKENLQQYVGNQSPIVSNSSIYKEMDASLDIEILPIVSGDNQITLDLKVTQADFTDRVGDEGPFGKVNREFVSTIRVKNQDMVLLGGLEEKRKNDSGSGFPILSRIPILKWFFSSKTNEDSKTKLNIFIKPTIIN